MHLKAEFDTSDDDDEEEEEEEEEKEDGASCRGPISETVLEHCIHSHEIDTDC